MLHFFHETEIFLLFITVFSILGNLISSLLEDTVGQCFNIFEVRILAIISLVRFFDKNVIFSFLLFIILIFLFRKSIQQTYFILLAYHCGIMIDIKRNLQEDVVLTEKWIGSLVDWIQMWHKKLMPKILSQKVFAIH